MSKDLPSLTFALILSSVLCIPMWICKSVCTCRPIVTWCWTKESTQNLQETFNSIFLSTICKKSLKIMTKKLWSSFTFFTLSLRKYSFNVPKQHLLSVYSVEWEPFYFSYVTQPFSVCNYLHVWKWWHSFKMLFIVWMPRCTHSKLPHTLHLCSSLTILCRKRRCITR